MKKPDISYLIATNREYSITSKRVIDSLEKIGALDSGEIIVCSPEEIKDSRVRYLKDNLAINGPMAFNYSALHAKGEILVVLCDDHEVSKYTNPRDIPKVLYGPMFQKRKFKIFTAASDGTCYTGAIPGVEKTYNIPRILMCRFPILDKKTLELLGGYIYHPNFNINGSFFADNYLSIYLAHHQEEPLESSKVRYHSFQHLLPKDAEEYNDKSVHEQCLDVYLKLIEEL